MVTAPKKEVVPKHIRDAFPWISSQPPSIKFSTRGVKGKALLEKEIIRIIFSPPVNELDDFRKTLIKSLKKYPEDRQVIYIKAVANCLANEVLNTPLSIEPKVWLNDVNQATLTLRGLVRQKPKNHLPAELNNMFSMVSQIVRTEISQGHVFSIQQEQILSSADEKLLFKDKADSEAHGISDFVAILNLVHHRTKALMGGNAIDFFKFPQTFFSEIAGDSNLSLEYQRRAVSGIGKVNQEYCGKRYPSLTAHVLSCIFKKKVTPKNVSVIISNLKSISK